MAIRLLHHATPKTDDTFHYFFSAGVRGHATDSPASSGFFQDVKEAFLEDKAILEKVHVGMKQAVTPHIDLGLDKGAKLFRQGLDRAIKAEATETVV